MTKNQLRLRQEAIELFFLENDQNGAHNRIMRLYNCLPNQDSYIKSLFRYRPLKMRELNCINNNTIYMSSSCFFEDEDDCRPLINVEEVSSFIISKKYPQFRHEIDIDKIVAGVLSSSGYLDKVKEERKSWMVSCLSNRMDNKKMWEGYANNNTGICIEYDFLSILKHMVELRKNNPLFYFLPVAYYSDVNELDCFKLNHEDLLNDSDSLVRKTIASCMIKDKNRYSAEEEWRILTKEERTIEAKGKEIPFIKPKSIICGKSIDIESAEYAQLIDIVKEKKISLKYL